SLGAFAILMGLSLVFLFDRPLVLLFGFAGMFLALFYNAPPFALKYRAVGEPATFMGFFLMFVGTYYVMTGTVTWESIVLGLPPGLLTASVLSTNNIRDIDNDRRAGFRTLAVVLGRKGMASLIVVMISVTFISVLSMIMLDKLPLLSLVAFITLPAALGVIRDIYNEFISLKAEGGAEDAPVRVSKIEVQMLYILAITLLAAFVLEPFLAQFDLPI
ncbi:MAG: prenyltransferase, partial [Acidilobaceae archaeon]